MTSTPDVPLSRDPGRPAHKPAIIQDARTFATHIRAAARASLPTSPHSQTAVPTTPGPGTVRRPLVAKRPGRTVCREAPASAEANAHVVPIRSAFKTFFRGPAPPPANQGRPTDRSADVASSSPRVKRRSPCPRVKRRSPWDRTSPGYAPMRGCRSGLQNPAQKIVCLSARPW